MSTSQELRARLKLYEKALFHYKLSKRFPFLKWRLKTFMGFCLYFDKKVGMQSHDIYFRFAELLPELYLQSPKVYKGYWFGSGEIEPRIKCLQAAIKLTKELIPVE